MSRVAMSGGRVFHGGFARPRSVSLTLFSSLGAALRVGLRLYAAGVVRVPASIVGII